MGSNFSAGNFRKDVLEFVNRDLVYIKSRLYRFEKMLDRNFEENTFLTKRQFQWVLQLNDLRTYYLFQIFDTENFGKVSRLDIFGALALATVDSPNDKIGFCFKLADLDNDDHLTKVEVEMMLICISRGFSRLKNIAIPGGHTIKKIVNELFRSKTVILNEKGNLCVRDLRAFCFANELLRTYFASLGTTVEVHDAGKLVRQRAALLDELAEIETRLSNCKSLLAENLSDSNAYEAERGGADIKLFN